MPTFNQLGNIVSQMQSVFGNTTTPQSTVSVISGNSLTNNISTVNRMMTDQLNAQQDVVTQRLQKEKDTAQNKVSAYGTISADINKLQDIMNKMKSADTFSTFKGTVTDATSGQSSKAVSVIAGSNATEQNMTVQVNQLAQNKITVADTAVSDKNSKVFSANTADSTQAFQISLVNSNNSQNNLTVTLDKTKSYSLQDIAGAINSDSNNKGKYSASVITQNGQSYLSVSTSVAGANGDFAITASGNSLMQGLNNNTKTTTLGRQAQDAQVVVNGQTQTSSTNTVSNVATGVTLNLTQADSTKTLNVAVTSDGSQVKSLFSNLVDSYNKVIDDLAKFKSTQLNSSDKNAKNAKDLNTVRSIEDKLNRMINTVAPTDQTGSNVSSLAQIGITRQSNGKLAVDNTTANNAVNNNLSNVVNFFTSANGGFATESTKTLRGLTTKGSDLEARTTDLNSVIGSLDQQRTGLQKTLDDARTNLQNQFQNLDNSLGNMLKTQAYLNLQSGNSTKNNQQNNFYDYFLGGIK